MERKVIARYKMKTVSPTGNKSNLRCTLFSNGVCVILQTFMAKESFTGATIIGNKFGHNIYSKDLSMKHSTMHKLIHFNIKLMLENGITEDQII